MPTTLLEPGFQVSDQAPGDHRSPEFLERPRLDLLHPPVRDAESPRDLAVRQAPVVLRRDVGAARLALPGARHHSSLAGKRPRAIAAARSFWSARFSIRSTHPGVSPRRLAPSPRLTAHR